MSYISGLGAGLIAGSLAVTFSYKTFYGDLINAHENGAIHLNGPQICLQHKPNEEISEEAVCFTYPDPVFD